MPLPKTVTAVFICALALSSCSIAPDYIGNAQRQAELEAIHAQSEAEEVKICNSFGGQMLSANRTWSGLQCYYGKPSFCSESCRLGVASERYDICYSVCMDKTPDFPKNNQQ
jgi:hypothetical protein